MAPNHGSPGDACHGVAARIIAPIAPRRNRSHTGSASRSGKTMIAPAVLARLPLFRGLSESALRELAARGALREYAPDETLWPAGARPFGLVVVLQGEVRVIRAFGGRQHVIHTEGAGGTLGDVALFSGTPYPATAVAARRTTCLVLERGAVLAAIREDPELASALLERLAARVRQLIERLDRITAWSVPTRLATFLLDRAQQAGTVSFTLGRTQQAVAEELGTVREVVVRGLRALREAGLIAAEARGRFRILDEARLRAIANGDADASRRGST